MRTQQALAELGTGELFYHIPWRSRSVQAGSHKTSLTGSGSDFARFVPLLDHPDPKRIDLRASLRTTPKQLMVRTFFERNAVNLIVVNDVSASMQFQGKLNKSQLQAEIVASIAWSAIRQGDYFGMVACDQVLHQDCRIRPVHRQGIAKTAVEALNKQFAKAVQTQNAATALPQALNGLTEQKSLVFLISDFHHSEALINDTFQAYRQHDVVPIVLWDIQEFQDLPDWGWYKVREMETGKQRNVFMRPGFKQQIFDALQAKKQRLRQLSQQYGLRLPFFIEGKFSAAMLSQHLSGGA